MAQALRDRGHDLLLGCQPGSDIMARAQGAHLPVESVRMRQDYDLPAAPILVDIRVNGRNVKAIAQVTKQAYTFVLVGTPGLPPTDGPRGMHFVGFPNKQ